MKLIIVTTYICFLFVCLDIFFNMMNAKNTIENIVGSISITILIVISIKSKFGVACYEYLKSKTKK